MPEEGFEIVMPSRSICRAPVAVVAVADKRGTRRSRAYLQFLYSREGQEIAARHDFRPATRPLRRVTPAFRKSAGRYWRLWWLAGGTEKALRQGSVFDQIYRPPATSRDDRFCRSPRMRA
jgi:sulfate transport system substrate-binding protein